MTEVCCTCGVVSGGKRDPRRGCPMHQAEDAWYWRSLDQGDEVRRLKSALGRVANLADAVISESEDA